EVAEQRLVVADLLVDVFLQIRRERRPERVVEAAGLLECRLRQRYGRADDLVLEDEIVRPELAQARMLDEPCVRVRERPDEKPELRPEAGARRVGRGQ